MLLSMLLPALNTRSPVENFLMGCVELQTDTKKGALSVVQLCIMHELANAARLYRDGNPKVTTPEVPLLHIQEKYDLERYTVSRNAIMLAEGGVKRKNPRTGKVTTAEGRGWVKQPKKGYIGTPDSRKMSLVLTKSGQRVADIMFNK